MPRNNKKKKNAYGTQQTLDSANETPETYLRTDSQIESEDPQKLESETNIITSSSNVDTQENQFVTEEKDLEGIKQNELKKDNLGSTENVEQPASPSKTKKIIKIIKKVKKKDTATPISGSLIADNQVNELDINNIKEPELNILANLVSNAVEKVAERENSHRSDIIETHNIEASKPVLVESDNHMKAPEANSIAEKLKSNSKEIDSREEVNFKADVNSNKPSKPVKKLENKESTSLKNESIQEPVKVTNNNKISVQESTATKQNDNNKKQAGVIIENSSFNTKYNYFDEKAIPDRHKELYEVFKIFDKDRNGSISRDEVKSLLASIGRECTQQEVDNLLLNVDKDKSGTIDFSEFVNYMDNLYTVPVDQVEEIVDAFRIFDLDNNGYVTKDEFKHILQNYGGNFTDEEVDMIFKETDVDKNGKLDYMEFVELWKYQ